MDKLVNLIIDFYKNNKDLSIALAGALVGVVGAWVFTKLGPWIVNIIRSTFDLIGRFIGGHYAYAGIRRKYLNWVVLQNQDLNLTGVIATGEKPKLEQVFISLKMMDDDKKTETDDATKRWQTGWLDKYITETPRLMLRELFSKFLPKNSNRGVNEVPASLFIRKPLWRFNQFFTRPAISNLLIFIIAILLVALPGYGLLGASNINNWGAGASTSVYIFLISLIILIERNAKINWKDPSEWTVPILFVITPLLILGISIKHFVVDEQQSPLAMSIGAAIAILLTIFSNAKIKINHQVDAINAKEVGKLLNLSDCIAILGKPGSGKSTYAQFVALTFAQEKAGQTRLRKHHIASTRFGCKKWYLPVLIPLRKVQGIKDKQNSQNLLLESFRQNVLPTEVRDILAT